MEAKLNWNDCIQRLSLMSKGENESLKEEVALRVVWMFKMCIPNSSFSTTMICRGKHSGQEHRVVNSKQSPRELEEEEEVGS